jgi:protoheme ferro-lyase
MFNIPYSKKWVHPMTQVVIKDIDGSEITLQHIMFEATTKVLPQDDQMSAADKMRWHSYATKIAAAEPLKTTALTKIKERGAKNLTILAYGFMLEGINEALGEVATEVEEV